MPSAAAISLMGSMTGKHCRLADAILIASCLVNLATIRDGHNWGDDFAHYITHAQNLASGRPYAATGYLFDRSAFIAPQAYPPGFPILLAPVYRVFGLNLVAFKVVVVVTWTIALLLFCRLFAPALGPWYLAVWALLVGFHPLFYGFKQQVLSEGAFVMWSAAALLAMERWWNASGQAGVWRGVAIGLAIAGAIATRPVGVALLAALILAAILSPRRASWPLVGAAAATCAAGMLVQLALIPGQGDYVTKAPWDSETGWRAQLYAADIVGVLPAMTANEGHSLLAAARSVLGVTAPLPRIRRTWIALFVLTIVILALIVSGYIARVRRGLSPLEAFPLLYLPPIMAYPFYQGQRYVLPLLPILFFYLLLGIRNLTLERRRIGQLALAAALVFVVVAQVRHLARTPYYVGIETDDARRFLAFIRDQTPPDAVVVSAKPRAIYLFTARAGFTMFADSDERLLQRLDATGVTHLTDGLPDGGYLRPFADRHPERFERLYESGPYVVYKVR